MTVSAGETRATYAHEVARLRSLVRVLLERTQQLQHALDSRIAIEQAKGVLAERLGISVGDAFEILRLAARSTRRTVHDVASDVLASSPVTPEAVAAAQRRLFSRGRA